MSNTDRQDLPMVPPTRASPRIPPSNGICPLLALPTELRLQIWEYVFYEPTGFFYRYKANDSTFGLYRTRTPTIQISNVDTAQPRIAHSPVVNLLKTICKRMYSDTKALPLKVNKQITFIQLDATQPTALEQFRMFATNCSKRSQSEMRLVILEDARKAPCERWSCYRDPPPWEPDRSSLEYAAWFCRTHPDASVVVKLHALNFEEDTRGSVLRIGYWIKTRLRRQECPWPYCAARLYNFNHELKDFAPVNVPANLRLFPTNATSQTLEPVYHPASWLRSYVPQPNIDFWIGMIDSWYQEGL
jgi:hypothetical protein